MIVFKGMLKIISFEEMYLKFIFSYYGKLIQGGENKTSGLVDKFRTNFRRA